MIRVLLTVLALFFVTRSARAEDRMAYTALSDVHACEPLDGGGTLVGTSGGLALVGKDGTPSRVWTVLDGLPETRVHALFAGGASTWVGTEKGVSEVRITGETLAIVRSFPSAPARAFASFGGAIYVGTWGGGLLRVGTPSMPIAFDGGVSPKITSLAVFEGALVASTAGSGMFKLVDGKMRPFVVPLVPETQWSLAVFAARLWIGTLEGTISVDARGIARREGDEDVRAFAVAGGALLAGSYGAGLLTSGAHFSAVSGLNAHARFVQAIGARGAARCIGTPSGAFAIGDAGGWQKLALGGLPSNDVTAILRDGDRLWVGTYDRGVAVLEAGTWRSVGAGLVDARVNAMTIERRASGDRLWVATARGLTSLPTSPTSPAQSFGGSGVLPSCVVHAVAPISGGGVLVGTEKGAAVVKDGAVTLIDEKKGVPLRAVWAVAEGPGGVLMLGTSAGLYAGKIGESWQRVSMASGHLRDDWITALTVRGSSVFVGTYNGGVSRLEWSDARAFTLGEHLGGGYVNTGGMLVDGTTLYVATMDGLLARPLQKDAAWRTVANAAPGRDVTGVLASPDGFWVSSRRGILHRQTL
jgi:hypothetical protein